MRAVIFERTGRPEDVISVGAAPQPACPPGAALIKVSANPIQPADFLFISGRYRIKPAFPQVAGLEGAGTIVTCGAGVTGLTPGQRVAFRSPGAWAEYVVAPVARIYPVPPGVSDAVACQFALNPLTAWALLAICDLPPNSRILITAGRSAVARLLTRLARRRQLQVALLVRNGGGYALLNGESGDTVVTAGSVEDVLAHAGTSNSYHAILDSVGGPNVLPLIDALEARGRLISYGVLDDREIVIRSSRILYKNMIWQGFGIDGWLDNTSKSELQTAQKELWELLVANPDLLPVAESFDLSRVVEAVLAASGGRQNGKVLLSR